MTAAIIITFCVLILLAYVFDISSSKTKIPTVILLLLLGWILNHFSNLFEFRIPDLTPLLPILGTIGLILIVLEGALELQLNKTKIPTIAKASFVALLPMLILSLTLAYVVSSMYNIPFKACLINVIPLSIISSAIAIPTVKYLSTGNKEFIIYESSLSDIFGVLFFNFVRSNEMVNLDAVGKFSFELFLIIVVSFIGTLLLVFLLNRLKHHVKYAPIIILVILIYEISKEYRLPSLLFILLFGLFIGNLDELKNIRWIHKLHPERLNREVHKLKGIIAEATFLVRTIFFLVFGYLIETPEILNINTLPWSIAIVCAIFGIRAICLKLMKVKLMPLLFIAPRGLITILLFLSIKPHQSIFLINRSLLIQVIIFTAMFLMAGMIFGNKKNAPGGSGEESIMS